jgi:carbon storage regulator CsrA
MLVLTRRVGESILIGDDVEVKVSEIGGGQVRLSFIAPRDVAIVRKEISRRVGGRVRKEWIQGQPDYRNSDGGCGRE